MSISMISLRLKGKWSIRQRQGFHSNSDGIIYPFAVTHITLNWYDPSLIFILPFGRKCKKGSQVLRFWRLMPKGERVLSPKQKDRTTNFKKIQNKVLIGIFSMGIYFNWCILKLVFGINWYLCFTWFVKVKFQIDIYLKTLLKAKRRISFRGSFV